MGFRFRRSVGVLPGVRVNFSKGVPSLSFGRRGLRYTIGARGNRFTVGLPGTGLSYTDYEPHRRAKDDRAPQANPTPRRAGRTPLFGFVLFSALMLAMWAWSVLQDSADAAHHTRSHHGTAVERLLR